MYMCIYIYYHINILLVVVSNVAGLCSRIYGIILPIDELIFFKMVMAVYMCMYIIYIYIC